MENKQMITETDIQAFYFAISQKQPKSVLDVGMFLKEIGSFTREFGKDSFSDEIRLCGIERDGVHFPVFDRLYDKLYRDDTDEMDEKIDLMIFLNRKPGVDDGFEKQILEWGSAHVAYYFTDYDDAKRNEFLVQYGTVNGFSLEEKNYAVVRFKG